MTRRSAPESAACSPTLDSIDWLFRRDGRWRYQAQVDNGRLVEKVGKPYVRDGQMVNGEPTVRITPRGWPHFTQSSAGLASSTTDRGGVAPPP